MSSFTPSGVEFVAKNLSGYLSDLARVDKAQQNLGKSASSVGSQFANAHTGASSFASRIGSMIPGVGGLASALGGVATVAGGIVAAQVFNKIVEGVGAFVSIGLSAVDAAQRLETGLGALLTMNNLYERTTETLTVATQSAGEWAEAQTEAAKKSDDLAFKQRELTAEINTQNASIQEQNQRIIQMADGLDKNQQIARLQEMEIALEGMTRELAETSTEQGKLNNLTQEYTTVTETSFKQVRGFAEAQEMAAKQSKELLHFVEKLAIVSPFEQDQVAIVAKLATAAGLGVETTKNFTAGFLDLAAAVGIGSDGLTFAADQLLQVAKIGKITTVDLRQLRRLGIDLEKIIGTQMGMSIEQFNAEAGKSPEIFNKLFEAVTEFSQNTFAGTAEKMATSLSGLRSTFSDIFSVGSKNLLRPLVEAVGPMASEMLGRLSDMVTGPQMAKIGEAIPKVLFGAFQSLSGEGEGGLFSGLKGLGLSSSMALEITNITKSINEFATGLSKTFSQFGARGVALNLLTQLGITHDALALFDKFKGLVVAIGSTISSVLTPALSGLSSGGILETINQGITFLNENFDSLKGALIGIGAVLGAGVLTGLAAGILALLSPINLLIVGIATLTAAWVGNWGNIQGITQQALTTITDLFNTHWPIIQAVALTAWEVLQGIFAGFQTALGPVTKQLQEQFTQIGTILTQLGLDWSDVWNAILTATGIVAAAIGAAILGVIGVVAGLATGIAEGVSAAITMFQNLATNVSGIITGLVGIVAGFNQTLTALLAGDFANAWEGAKVLLQGFATFFSNMWAGMITVATGTLDILASTIGGFVEGAVGFFQGMYNQIVGHSIVPDLVNEIVKWFKGLPQKILNGLSDLASKISAPFKEVQETISEVLNVDDWMTLGADLMAGLLEGIEKNADKVLEFLKNLAYDSLASLKGIWMSSSPSRAFAEEGKNAVDGLVKGATDNAAQVTRTFGGLGQSAINSLMTGMSATDPAFIHDFIDDLDMGGIAKDAGTGGGQWRNFRNILKNEITAGMSGLEAGSIDFMQKITDVANRFNFPPNLAREFAKAEGLIGHLTGTFSVMFQKMRIENLTASASLASQFNSIGQSFGDMIQGQMDAFSQSKEAAVKLGDENTKLTGTLVSQQTELSKLQTELSKLTTGAGSNAMSIEKITESLGFGERQLEIYRQELAKLAEGSLEWDKKKLAIDKLTESMDMQQQQLEKLTAASDIDIISIQKKQQEIAKLTEEIDKNKKAIEANKTTLTANRQSLIDAVFASTAALASGAEKLQGDLARMELFKEFLGGSEEELNIMGEIFKGTGILDTMSFNRVQAQEELNRLLLEQQRREEAITKQKEAQQKLDFLSQQLNLVKMISDRGLNPANILGGLTLGLGASTEDLLEATNRVVEAMINQINADLQITSPSKVMARIGRRVIEGMAMGLEGGRSLLDRAIGSTPLLNGSLMRPQPQPAYASGGDTYNYQFPMTVHTTASAQATIRQYEVKRSMYAS